jgi:hypothetical protein
MRRSGLRVEGDERQKAERLAGVRQGEQTEQTSSRFAPEQ